MEDHTLEALQNARRLRRNMSLPEAMLWRQLKQRPLGVKFRNQHPIRQMVVDFYCAQSRLVIEIDGISHDLGDNPERDARRDANLRSLGFEIVRIAATEVLKDPLAVADSLARQCLAIPPPPALRAATSPKGGDSFSGVAA